MFYIEISFSLFWNSKVCALKFCSILHLSDAALNDSYLSTARFQVLNDVIKKSLLVSKASKNNP